MFLYKKIKLRLKQSSEKKVLGDVFLGFGDGLNDIIKALLKFVEIGVD